MTTKCQTYASWGATFSMVVAFIACCISIGAQWSYVEYDTAPFSISNSGAITGWSHSLWTVTWKTEKGGFGNLLSSDDEEEKSNSEDIDSFCKAERANQEFCSDIAAIRGFSITAMILTVTSSGIFIWGLCLQRHGHEAFVMLLNIAGYVAIPAIGLTAFAVMWGYEVKDKLEKAENEGTTPDQFLFLKWETPTRVEAGAGLQLQLVACIFTGVSLILALMMRTMCWNCTGTAYSGSSKHKGGGNTSAISTLGPGGGHQPTAAPPQYQNGGFPQQQQQQQQQYPGGAPPHGMQQSAFGQPQVEYVQPTSGQWGGQQFVQPQRGMSGQFGGQPMTNVTVTVNPGPQSYGQNQGMYGV
jgi:hypothetical protein